MERRTNRKTRTLKRRVFRWGRRAALAGAAAAGVVILWSDHIVHEIPPGHGGVLWLRLLGGTVEQPALREGVHLTFPWDAIFLYDIRFRTLDHQTTAVTRDGLSVGLTVTYRYRPSPDTLGTLHQRVGPRYEDVLVRGSLDAALREVVSGYTSAELHGMERGAISAGILAALTDDLRRGSLSAGTQDAASMVEVEEVLIRAYTLPPSVAAAVERKNRQLHLVGEWDHRIRRESAESHRKAVEARGIDVFQKQLMAQGDMEKYLRLRGIAATEALISAPTSKTIVMGAAGRQPPVIVSFLPEDAPVLPVLPMAEEALPSPVNDTAQTQADVAEAVAADPPEHPTLARVRGVWQRFVKMIGRWTGLGGGAG